MKDALVAFGVLLTGSATAAWLRLFDRALALQSWKDLIGKPVKLWFGAILISPIIEFISNLLFYILFTLLFYLLLFALKSSKPEIRKITLCSTILGLVTRIISATLNSDWSTYTKDYNIKCLIIYSVVGVFYSLCFYLFSRAFKSKVSLL